MEVILIGPIGAGKSTVAELLSEKLNLPQVSMDGVRFDYYKGNWVYFYRIKRTI